MFVLQKRMEDLKKERKKVQDQIAMAENQLKATEDLLRMLKDSKTVSTQTGRVISCCNCILPHVHSQIQYTEVSDASIISGTHMILTSVVIQPMYTTHFDNT